MKSRRMIGIVSAVFAIGLVGSSAFAAKTESGVGSTSRLGAQPVITNTNADAYPAYQPLEVCDDVCIFY